MLQSNPTLANTDSNFLFQKAYDYEQQQNLQNAIIYYKKAADQGHTNAAFNLGVILEKNDNYKDLNEAITYYRFAARNGQIDAAFNLGVILEKNDNHRNLEEAKKFYTIAATRHHIDSAFNLGVILEKYEALKDLELAKKYYSQAVEHAHPGASYNLALIYLDSRSNAEQDQARKLLSIAADKNYEDARTRLNGLKEIYISSTNEEIKFIEVHEAGIYTASELKEIFVIFNQINAILIKNFSNNDRIDFSKIPFLKSLNDISYENKDHNAIVIFCTDTNEEIVTLLETDLSSLSLKNFLFGTINNEKYAEEL